MAKVAMSIDPRLLAEVDRWVAAGEFPNRSQALRAALLGLQDRRRRRRRLLKELAKIDRREERSLVKEPLRAEAPWPEC